MTNTTTIFNWWYHSTNYLRSHKTSSSQLHKMISLRSRIMSPRLWIIANKAYLLVAKRRYIYNCETIQTVYYCIQTVLYCILWDCVLLYIVSCMNLCRYLQSTQQVWMLAVIFDNISGSIWSGTCVGIRKIIRVRLRYHRLDKIKWGKSSVRFVKLKLDLVMIGSTNKINLN